MLTKLKHQSECCRIIVINPMYALSILSLAPSLDEESRGVISLLSTQEICEQISTTTYHAPMLVRPISAPLGNLHDMIRVSEGYSLVGRRMLLAFLANYVDQHSETLGPQTLPLEDPISFTSRKTFKVKRPESSKFENLYLIGGDAFTLDGSFQLRLVPEYPTGSHLLEVQTV